MYVEAKRVREVTSTQESSGCVNSTEDTFGGCRDPWVSFLESSFPVTPTFRAVDLPESESQSGSTGSDSQPHYGLPSVTSRTESVVVFVPRS